MEIPYQIVGIPQTDEVDFKNEVRVMKIRDLTAIRKLKGCPS